MCLWMGDIILSIKLLVLIPYAQPLQLVRRQRCRRLARNGPLAEQDDASWGLVVQGDLVQQVGVPVFVRVGEEVEVCVFVGVGVGRQIDAFLAADGAAHCRVQVAESEGGERGCGRVEVACVSGAEVAPEHNEPVRRFCG